MRFSFAILDLALAYLRPVVGHSIRLYFAPITGAVKGIRQEYRRLCRCERARRVALSPHGSRTAPKGQLRRPRNSSTAWPFEL